LRSHEHRLNVELPPEPLLLNVDQTRMVQVLANLLSNAFKFTAQGKVTLKMKMKMKMKMELATHGWGFDNDTLQERVHHLLYESLRRFGVLALGSQESLRGPLEKRYEELDGHEKLYRRVT